ncbi:hypothetical protein [Streptomyces physcomitrii]|uniref:Acyl-CoA dehydrogenase C-terminal domain-containing protein n=1 Tax=Streptomyces physcomitrii TaxID=2724184 RepID=A0ABX1H7Z6_9ACTN|nr:hypothetical protein [Streptomyces physcomitrii]NKI44167.1 hypothetical protein [Streptomyces physcomitrii]
MASTALPKECPGCAADLPGADSATPSPTCEGLLCRIAEAAEKTEQRGRPSGDLLRDLVAHGCLRLTLARKYGGTETALPELLRTLREIAVADASVAWNVMVWAQSQITLARLRLPAFEKVVGSGPDVVVSATSAGDGSVTDAGDGPRLSGSWRFTSGVHHAEWVLLHCRAALGEGEEAQGVLVRKPMLRVDSSWDVLGLRGTGSETVHAREIPVAEEDLYPLQGHLSAAATPHSLLPVRPAFALHTAAVAIGTAQAALACLTAPPQQTGRGQEDGRDLLQEWQLGDRRARLDAALAGLEHQGRGAWSLVASGGALTAGDATALAAAAVHGVGTAVEIGLWCFQNAGSAALFNGTPVQRRLRDLLAIAQHANVRPSQLADFGRQLMAPQRGEG